VAVDTREKMIHKVNMVHTLTARAPQRRRAAAAGFIPHAHRRDTKTDAIVQTAFRVLEADGIDGLTLQRVAHALGLTTTALYRYFPSKDALLAALQRQAITELHHDLAATLAAAEPLLTPLAPPVAALARVLTVARFYQALPQSHAQAYRLVATLLGDPRQLIADADAAAAVPLLVALLTDVQTLLDAAVAAGSLAAGDPQARALTLWATLHGLNQLAKLARLAPGKAPLAGIGHTATTTLLQGFGAHPAHIEHAQAALDQPRPRLRRGGIR
jgi:AcrR family transcriptional regulator